MKKITLTEITADYRIKNRKGNYLYTVYLGNRTFHKFKSKRAAKVFLQKTYKFLTQKLHELRSIYANVFIQYNNAWPVLEYWRIREITTQIKWIEYQTDRITGCGPSLNTFSFNAINNGCGGCIKIIKHLQDKAKKSSNAPVLYQLDNLIRYIRALANELDNYGVVEASGYNEVHEKIESKHEYKPLTKVA